MLIYGAILSPLIPHRLMINDSKKETWKFLLQVLISILTAIATALGTTSCMSALAMV